MDLMCQVVTSGPGMLLIQKPGKPTRGHITGWGKHHGCPMCWLCMQLLLASRDIHGTGGPGVSATKLPVVTSDHGSSVSLSAMQTQSLDLVDHVSLSGAPSQVSMCPRESFSGFPVPWKQLSGSPVRPPNGERNPKGVDARSHTLTLTVWSQTPLPTHACDPETWPRSRTPGLSMVGTHPCGLSMWLQHQPWSARSHTHQSSSSRHPENSSPPSRPQLVLGFTLPVVDPDSSGASGRAWSSPGRRRCSPRRGWALHTWAHCQQCVGCSLVPPLAAFGGLWSERPVPKLAFGLCFCGFI